MSSGGTGKPHKYFYGQNQKCFGTTCHRQICADLKRKICLSDGGIADFDNPEVVEKLLQTGIPVVGVGGSYENEDDYPNVPYVATDNVAIVEMAFEHLKAKAIRDLLI